MYNCRSMHKSWFLNTMEKNKVERKAKIIQFTATWIKSERLKLNEVKGRRSILDTCTLRTIKDKIKELTVSNN